MKISILIPCYNEELTVATCIESCLAQTRPADEIVVVNDGSTDGSLKVLQSFGEKIKLVQTPKNTGGKSRAQEYAINFVTGDVMVMTDADTILEKNFLEEVEKSFQDPNVHAFAGYVKSMKHNWLTACRELDYIIGQDIHKKAQSNMDSVLVIPGCGGAFRMETFRKYITFEHDTITEDLDFTYKFHKNELKIAYNPNAVVYTQDPDTLKSYIYQTRRWVGGGWQNLMKHWRIIVSRKGHALQISFNYAEGLLFGALFFILPIINIYYAVYFFSVYFTTAIAFGIYGALRRKRLDLFLYSPFFPFMLVINSFIFFEQFIKEVILGRKEVGWFKPERRSFETL